MSTKLGGHYLFRQIGWAEGGGGGVKTVPPKSKLTLKSGIKFVSRYAFFRRPLCKCSFSISQMVIL
ncbi:hypothetical protein HOLleu_25087 [Holothuria leucospilota]|uniref:Uncharacterized protein n=1 Tax=Holothuria leucospilota TaxID=206669 RepID=A0A9Q1BS75_HOLLE|nr:hypothetical protein HOLleu_25087 [Holothuria leucospilota]